MKSEFVAACGTYHVMSRLAQYEIHAAATFGNAPHVDILVSSADGYSSLAIQVKTAPLPEGHGDAVSPKNLIAMSGL